MPTTWNPADKTAGVTLSGGNLIAAFAGSFQGVRSVDRVYTGKYYWEVVFTTTTNASVGVALGTSSLTTDGTTNLLFECLNSGALFLNGNSLSLNIGGTVTNGWTCCFALDADNDLIWCRNGAAGNWNGNAANNPATGVGGVSIASFSAGPMGIYVWGFGGGGGGTLTANFGASAFIGSVPGGFASGFPSGTTLSLIAMASAVPREVLFTTTPSLQLSGLAREVLLTSATALTVASVVREVLLVTPVALPQQTAVCVIVS